MLLSQAARELGVSHVTVWRHVQAERLKAEKVGTIYLIAADDLEAFKANRKKPGRPRKPAPAPPDA